MPQNLTISPTAPHPWNLLYHPNIPLQSLTYPLAYPIIPDLIDIRAFTTTEGIRLWLFVFEFPNQSSALANFSAETLNLKPPFYVKFTLNGQYVLAVGFPSDKPPSPEMLDFQTKFLSGFAGEE